MIKELIKSHRSNLSFMDGFDDCILGVSLRFGQEPVIAYDYEKIINQLISEGLDYETAVLYFEHYCLGYCAENQTPCFVHLLK